MIISTICVGTSGARNMDRIIDYISSQNSTISEDIKQSFIENNYLIGADIPSIRNPKITKRYIISEASSERDILILWEDRLEEIKTIIADIGSKSDIIIIITGGGDAFSLYFGPLLTQLFYTLFPKKVILLLSIFNDSVTTRNSVKIAHYFGRIQLIRRYSPTNNLLHIAINEAQFNKAFDRDTSFAHAVLSLINPLLDALDPNKWIENVNDEANFKMLIELGGAPLDNISVKEGILNMNSIVVPLLILPFDDLHGNNFDIERLLKESAISTKLLFDKQRKFDVDEICSEVEDKFHRINRKKETDPKGTASNICGSTVTFYNVGHPSISSATILVLTNDLTQKQVNFIKTFKNAIENHFYFIHPFDGASKFNVKNLRSNINVQIIYGHSTGRPQIVTLFNGARGLHLANAVYTAENFINSILDNSKQDWSGIISVEDEFGPTFFESIEEIERYLGEEHRIFKSKREELISDVILRSVAEALNEPFGNKEYRMIIYKDMVTKALADDKITEEETAILKRFKEIAHISKEEHEALVSQIKAMYYILKIGRKSNIDIYGEFKQIALANGKVSKDEKALLDIIKQYLRSVE